MAGSAKDVKDERSPCDIIGIGNVTEIRYSKEMVEEVVLIHSEMLAPKIWKVHQCKRLIDVTECGANGSVRGTRLKSVLPVTNEICAVMISPAREVTNTQFVLFGALRHRFDLHSDTPNEFPEMRFLFNELHQLGRFPLQSAIDQLAVAREVQDHVLEHLFPYCSTESSL